MATVLRVPGNAPQTRHSLCENLLWPTTLCIIQEEAVENATNSLALISFSMWDAATSQTYQNVDMSLDIEVAALYFLCNRPTVAALMCFGNDIIFPPPPDTTSSSGAAPACTAATEPSPDTPVAPEGPETVSCAGEIDAEASPVTDPGGVDRGPRHRSSHDTPVALSGGDLRTLFKLRLVVSKLELQMGYEGYSVTPLLQCNVTDFDMSVDVHPETLLLTAELGNAQVEDVCMPVGSPYRQICGLRTDVATSLISTQFRWASLCCATCCECVLET